ncbi:unannotated protein [freshwater metagenome]|uniref:Unannotated protein n=1 Tax=freshwater metagenome TaxID=449393 RepID=A0A6J6U1P7_9ZZZZ
MIVATRNIDAVPFTRPVTVPPVDVETESVKVDQGSLSEFRYWIT